MICYLTCMLIRPAMSEQRFMGRIYDRLSWIMSRESQCITVGPLRALIAQPSLWWFYFVFNRDDQSSFTVIPMSKHTCTGLRVYLKSFAATWKTSQSTTLYHCTCHKEFYEQNPDEETFSQNLINLNRDLHLVSGTKCWNISTACLGENDYLTSSFIIIIRRE